MRRSIKLLSAAVFHLLAAANSVSAQETYFTTTGAQVGLLDIFQDCDVCPEMIVLPLGTYQMGSSAKEAIAARRLFHFNNNIDLSEFD